MFALTAHPERVDPAAFAPMANALRGASAPARIRTDDPRTPRCIAAAMPAGLLPEDVYDTQPLLSADGNYLFVCSARLDNRADLLGLLDLPPALADSDVLLAAYRRWGSACMTHLTGAYAFAAWSRSGRELIAAVDHLGQARLFYAPSCGGLLLGTQLAALRVCPGAHFTLDEAALGLFAEDRFEPGTTPWREIHSLPGGRMLLWKDGRLQTRRWWTPATTPSTPFRKPADYTERARELFEHAVQSCLRSATPVISTLSGGLDSSLVTAVAARCLQRTGHELTAFTAAPDLERSVVRRRGWDPDDAPHAALTAALHPNLRHVILRGDDRVALDLFPQIHQRSATPVRNGANYLWIDRIAQAATDGGSRVLLVGAHGNFGLSYTGLGAFAELMQVLQWRAAYRFAVSAHQAGERALWKTVLGGLLPGPLFSLFHRLFYSESAPRHERLHLTSPAFRSEHRRHMNPPRPAPRTRAAFVRKAASASAVWTADPMAQWGIALRDPTADRSLLEFLLTLPLAAFAPGGRSRGLARDLGLGLLPESVRLRRTQGQQSANYPAVLQQHTARYLDLACRMEASPACREIFDLPRVHEALSHVASGKASLILCGDLERAVAAGTFLLDDGQSGC